MSIYRYHGSQVWTMDFMYMGQRIRESTHQTSKTRAQEVHDKRKQQLRDSVSGYKKRSRPVLMSVAASQWLEERKSAWSPKMYVIEKTNISHLSPEFGRLLLPDIEARHIARYQQRRLSEEASPKNDQSRNWNSAGNLASSQSMGEHSEISHDAPGERRDGQSVDC